jgi:hypothetical protein
VREVARIELTQRHREADAHVLDPPDLTGAHAREQALERGMEHGVVIDGERHVARCGERTELGSLGRGERQRLLDEHADAQVEELARDGDVQRGRHQHVGDVDPQRLELGELRDGVGHAVPPRRGLGAREVGIAHGDQLDSARRAEDLEVELGDEACADDGDAGRALLGGDRHGGAEMRRRATSSVRGAS